MLSAALVRVSMMAIISAAVNAGRRLKKKTA
jgi:hypothetical protein